ncbi:transmembrane protein 44 [Brachyistius frenatus]|uniref:transmembrane protein 44 n=1 Tax=Brachyistius frenatus TaxID=100188 RepID=UPI0037E8ECD7
MERYTWFTDGQPGGSTNNFLTNLITFCLDSVSTCFSREADELCVPAGLTLLSALLLLLSCPLAVYQRCKYRGESRGETLIVFYCFLGNLCSTVGAIQSRQLHIQILMGALAAAIDAVNCIVCCLPVLMCWNSRTERRLRMMKSRRRQYLLAVCVLLMVTGDFLKSRVTQPQSLSPGRGRRLLYVPLHVSSWSPLMDNTEILGYILGLLSFVITCSSRFPALCRACRGHTLTPVNIFSGLLCSLAGALYTAAILLYDTRFGFLIRVMPWLLSSTGCVTLDLLILVTHWCKRGSRQRPRRFSADMESLLADSGEDNIVLKSKRQQHIHSSAQTKYPTFLSKTTNVQKMTEMGQYMDISVQPAKKGEEEEDGPLNWMVRVIKVNSLYSSDTSYDSSVVSSDLEWEFEAADAQWSEPIAKQQEGEEFPLQEWPSNPKPFNVCTCSISRLPQKTLSGTEEPAVSSAK